MSEDILAQFKQEGSDPFANMEDTPAESPAVKETEEDTPAVGEVPAEENVPFHKHPRWIEREAELQALKERDETISNELAELKAMRSEKPSDIPEWFRELYGDNQKGWEKYAEREAAREQEIEDKIIARQIQQSQQQQKETDRWNQWVDKEIDALKAEGHEFDRDKLIQTMLDFRPTDAQNNFDFKAGIKIYEALENKSVGKDTAKSQARKELADISAQSGRGEGKVKDYQTSSTLRNRSWGSL